ncbi:2-hydroxyacid dehydrogenase [Microbacterium sp. YJN-G]|uniref:2-hydroxyacid dehydrogenase n=1 Tax=Microbacterium sp. YJN-G TaxID=2763257 RepID=UPI0018776659|nr:NAD(P)-dependent oxidoreductase [Microbacterium sp. YJN-G]
MTYRVAVTRGYAEADGTTIFGDIGLDRLTQGGLEWCVLDEPMSPLRARELEGFDAAIVLGPEEFDASSIPSGGRLRHVARFGAGYDAVDVAACTAAGIVLTNTADAVREPMAHTALALLLGLAHNILIKDRLVRTGRWAERAEHRGRGLQGATVGIVGFGGVGQAVARLVAALGVRVVAYNRSDRSAEADDIGVEMLPLDEVMAASDYAIVTVSANPETRHLIGDRELGLLGHGGRLINIARGSVVDETALIRRLEAGELAGAGLDVFEQEPVDGQNPLLAMDSVIVAPHSLCWTDGFTAAVSASVMRSVLAVAAGETPETAVNAVPARAGTL